MSLGGALGRVLVRGRKASAEAAVRRYVARVGMAHAAKLRDEVAGLVRSGDRDEAARLVRRTLKRHAIDLPAEAAGDVAAWCHRNAS